MNGMTTDDYFELKDKEKDKDNDANTNESLIGIKSWRQQQGGGGGGGYIGGRLRHIR